MPIVARPVLLAVAVLLALTGCGSTAPTHAEHGTTTSQAPADAEFNDADVAFATAMIPHHAQALTMVDMTRGRTLSPRVRRLVADIEQAQAPEIEQMTQWLEDWGKPVPATGREHGSEHASEQADGEPAGHGEGMMTAEQLAELADAKGPAFERRWLELMVAHHRGAVRMAQAEQADGKFKDAVRLAEAIEHGQAREIAQMQSWLGS